MLTFVKKDQQSTLIMKKIGWNNITWKTSTKFVDEIKKIVKKNFSEVILLSLDKNHKIFEL